MGEEDHGLVFVDPIDATPPTMEVELDEEACEGHVCRNGGTCYTSITGS